MAPREINGALYTFAAADTSIDKSPGDWGIVFVNGSSFAAKVTVEFTDDGTAYPMHVAGSDDAEIAARLLRQCGGNGRLVDEPEHGEGL